MNDSAIIKRAKTLRRQCKSYNKISKRLGVSKSTLFSWLSKYKWSQKMSLKLSRVSNKRNWALFKIYVNKRKKQRLITYSKARKQAAIEIKQFVKDPLFVAGICIYWGEGDKLTPSQVRISNIDWQMLNLFKLFLQKYSGLPNERMHAYVVTYPDHDAKECLNFWSKHIPLSQQQFYKTQIIIGKHKTRRVKYGICSLSLSNRVFKEKLLTWIDFLPRLIGARV